MRRIGWDASASALPSPSAPTPLETHMDASHILVLVIAGLSALSVVTFTGAFLAMTREAREKR